MTQLQPADVDALRCDFVHSVYAYFQCKKYSISCTLADAKQRYLDYKLASSDCELTEDQTCSLVNKVGPTLAVECAVNTPCSAQALVSLKNTSVNLVYTPTIVDETFADAAPVFTAKPSLTLSPNSIYHNSTLDVAILDQDLAVIDTATFSTGKAKVGASVVTDPIYSLSAFVRWGLVNVANNPTGYLKSIKIYYTNTLGQYVPSNFWIIDVSPTSPYLSCGTCDPVNPADLLFGASNATWSAAIQKVVNNAVRDLTGGVNIGFKASKQDVAPYWVTMDTTVKHLPNSTWCGLRPKDYVMSWFNGSGTVKTSSTGFSFPYNAPTGNLYGKQTFTLACGTKDIEVANTMSHMNDIMDQVNSEFNEIKLLSNKTSVPATIVNVTPLDCSSTSYTALITSDEVITLVQWLDEDLTVVGTGFTFVPSSTGDYTCRVTLSTGCVLNKPFTVN